MPLKLFLLCSGLGRIRRGFESFTQECFEALLLAPELEVTLFKGAGERQERELPLWNLPRNSTAARRLAKYTGKSSYTIEQATFCGSLLPHIQRQQPDVIYFSDTDIGNWLGQWRRLTRQRFKLLFANGGPLSPYEYPTCDRVQQVIPTYFQEALKAGVSAEKQVLVPYGTKMPPNLPTLTSAERVALRQTLNLPDVPLILSVGNISKRHKRMDYLIREVASLPSPRPFLLLLGQQDAESPEIIQLGTSLLGSDRFQARTVAPSEVANYYKAADIFVLASLIEGFGRVFLEAMSYGLPCLVHDYEITHYVLGKEGYFANFEQVGSLTHLISEVLAGGPDLMQQQQRHRAVYDRFSWETLRPDYVSMIQQCATSK